MGLASQIKTTYILQEKTVRRIGLGPGVPGDWSPAANFNIFSITGGPIKITNMFGHVTAVFAGAAATPLIEFAPALVPPALVWNPLCVIAAVAAFALNSLMVWDGSLTAVSGVLRETANLGHDQATDGVGTAATAETWSSPIIIIPGTIRITNAGALDATGMIDWYLSYKPLTLTSQVVAL